ncbi:MAG: L-threonylcarbamoyladenylate synthase [Arenicella sp.]
MGASIQHAVAALRSGGVIAYPTEYCFGLGCDPRNTTALARLLKIKQRKKEQGVILIASTIEQISYYAELGDLVRLKEITDSWPGPNTWVLPAKDTVSNWVRGEHCSVAMRISDHAVCLSLCREFGHPIVSTSANRHGRDALLSAADIIEEFADELDYVIDASVGDATTASTIRDAITGQQFR